MVSRNRWKILSTLAGLLVIYYVAMSRILYRVIDDYIENQEPYFINWTATENISCHYYETEQTLPSAEDLSPPERSIFFHETSCRGGLNSRQACSVESVARKHPERLVYVLFSSSVSEVALKRSCLALLARLKNVRLARLHIIQYAKGTPLFEMLSHKNNSVGKFQIETTSDILRFLTMYKYGGVYLDTDVLVVRPLDALGNNWAALEDYEYVNIAAIALTKDGIGGRITSAILQRIKSKFRPNIWSHTGPLTMKHVLSKLCMQTDILVSRTHPAHFICDGFKVYSASVLYPVYFENCEVYFKAGNLPANTTKYSFTHHLWNRLTYNLPVEKGSPYEKLAQEHCPSVREMYGDRFGW